MPAVRTLALALTLVLVTSFAAPSGARALFASGFIYTVDGSGNATVTDCDDMCPTTLEIPGILDGHAVTSIHSNAFDSSSLIIVTIPDSVTSIGYNAFYNNAITTLTIGNSVVSIGDFALYGNRLTTLTIPNSVETIGYQSFYDNKLETLTIGTSVTSIGFEAFALNSLTSVTFLGNAPTAGTDVFRINTSLTQVTVNPTTTGWGLTWSGISVQPTATLSFTKPADVTIGVEPISLVATTSNTDSSTVTFTVDEGSNATTNFLAATSVSQSFAVTVPADARATAEIMPTVTGRAKVGKRLTAVKGTWTGYPTPTYSYQWYACTSVVSVVTEAVPGTCAVIKKATQSTFKLRAKQKRKYVTVLVTGASTRTAATTWLSRTTAKVQ
ncbi:MAG: leucine-rich repeat domain-containing protein [Chloroflexota bacterium]